MKNILHEKPQKNLSGRLLYTTNHFVDNDDIRNKVVLNIGCGYGWFEIWAIKNGVKKIYGIEIDKKSLKTAKLIKDPKAVFEVGSAINIPYPDKMFDMVVSWEVLEHIPKKKEDKMYKEVSRVLKNNGVFYLSTPSKNFWACVLDPAWWLIAHRHYKMKDLTMFGKKTKLKVIKFNTVGRMWEAFGMLNLYFSKWILKRSPIFQNIFEKHKNSEYSTNTGWTTHFVKYKKLP